MNRPQRSRKSSSPLASTALAVTITDLVAEYLVRHQFKNDGDVAIEAVFSFPVPLDAAFLGMQATLAGETLLAQIQPQRQASRTYDDAIADGNSAVLLSAPEPGLLNVSLGNLRPGESGEIELRFAAALRVADRTARFSLPLVHRPRYGTWRLEELETPSHDFASGHPMSASIRVEGLLASAPVNCVTHAARFARNGDALELSIAQAMLDRDLVLTFDLARELAPVGRLVADGDACLGLASFVLPARVEAPKPLDLCLVLDGSGSMSGDAIEQSRLAMGAVIEALGDQDRIQVLRFGSTVVSMFRRPLLATSRVRDALRELVPTINSELGGTEMGEALARALGQLGPVEADRSRAIILVTDGAVQTDDIAEAQAAALRAGVRIFVVAVGSSAGAEVLGPLAEATGAVLERAVPAEPISDGVMRQFRRSREAGTVEMRVTWPGSDAVPISMGIAYPGDAVSLAACLPAGVDGAIAIDAPSLGFSLRLPLGTCTAAPALRALLGQQQYRLAEREAREALAMRYGLLTKDTSAVLVKIRAENDKADGLPTIVSIRQMVPQGMASAVMPSCFSPCASHPDRNASDVSPVIRESMHDITTAPEKRSPLQTFASANDVRRIANALLETLRLDWMEGDNIGHFLYWDVVNQLQESDRTLACAILDNIGIYEFDDPTEGLILFVATLEALGLEISDALEMVVAKALSGDADDFGRMEQIRDQLGVLLVEGLTYSVAEVVNESPD